MSFQVSPAVNVTEIDLTTSVPAVSTTEAGIGGVFRWGPVAKTLLIDSEDKLAARFGKPTNFNAETFFSAANFLAYSNKLYVSRAANTSGFTNTASVVTNSNTTITANGTAIGTVAGDLVYGTGVLEGTVVVSVSDSEVVISSNTTSSTTTTLVFANSHSVYSAVANASALGINDELGLFTVKNEDDYLLKEASFPTSSSVQYIAKYPGLMGNSLKISVCDSSNTYSSNVNAFIADETYGVVTGRVVANGDPGAFSNAGIVISVGSNTANVFVTNNQVFASPDSSAGAANCMTNFLAGEFSVGDVLRIGNTSIGFQDLRITAIGTGAYDAGNTVATINFDSNYSLSTNFYSNTINRNWEYYNNVERAPSQSQYVKTFGNTAANDQLHIVIADEDGKFTGVPGTILEVFKNLSRASDAKSEDGNTLYYKTVINDNSNYVWFTKDRTGAVSNTALSIQSSTNNKAMTLSFGAGTDGPAEDAVPFATIARAYDAFRSTEQVDVRKIIQGKARGGTNGEQLANYLIDNIAEYRKDCVVFISPEKADVVNNAGHDEEADVVTFCDSLTASSYGFMDSGYKYQYDKYNDVYRWIPLNGDTAGIDARTSDIRDPWWSPGGFERGQYKNVIKLAFNPTKAQRDILYKAGVNPVVTFPGKGTVLFGDKTLLANEGSAFSRINVRNLFIVLEKAIATASEFTLFQFNDAFTRARFKNIVEPFLRDVMGRRGITDFVVVCDSTNNTSEVVDRFEFIGDIYIKPARAINYIQLNFVAVRSGVSFSEIVNVR